MCEKESVCRESMYEGERERESASLYVRERVSVCVREREIYRECVCETTERERMFV